MEADNLHVRGQKMELPDEDLEYKISHKTKEGTVKLTISIEWVDPQFLLPSLDD
ncbi:hypothetical protein ACI2OX_06545 [Bacillus sp. N9]